LIIRTRAGVVSDNRFIRDITRSAWIDADGNAPEANAQAIDDVRLSRPSVKDTSDAEELIFQLISYWQEHRIRVPRPTYQPDEPGYEPQWEDDET
jgi:hypothetical protein